MKTANRNNNFNFLRLLLATLVILSHAPELKDGNRSHEILSRIFHTISFGEFAVDGFFLLSGYLIVQSWCSQPQALVFLKKRFLRIYPGFIAASLVCVFIVGPLGAASPAKYFSELSLAWTALCMAILHGPILPPIFDGTPYPQVNGAMWTIFREFTCYLSVLIMGSIGALKGRRYWSAATLVIFSIWIFEKLGPRFGIPLLDQILEDPIIRLAALFFSGGCFYLYRDVVRYTGSTALIALALLIPLMYSRFAAEMALALFGGYLLFFVALTHNRVLAPMGKMADVSYGIYLYGWPAEKLLLWFIPSISAWILFPTALAVCIVVGMISWHAIEKPFLRLKPRAAAQLQPAATTMAAD